MNEVAQRHAHALSILLLVLRVASAPAPLYAQAECAAPFIRVENAVPPAWREALRDACERISTGQDIDGALTVHVHFQAIEAVLVALRDDGRETTREVGTPDELLATLQALIMLPPDSPQPKAAAPVAHHDLARGPPERAREPSPERPTKVPLRVEFGAEVMSRIAWTPAYLSPALALRVGFRLDGWMFGLDARTEPYQIPLGRTPSGFEMDGFGVGVFLTRRVIETEAVACDVGARAFLGVENQALEADELANNASEVDARVGAIARVALGSGTPRWTIALDAEVSPVRLRREFKIYQYLPGVSVGLGLGVALESP